MTDVSPVTKGGYPVQEVETEFEDEPEDDEEQQEQPREVEEELDDDSTAQDPDYVVPEENRDVWKNFGCDTEAGRALRRLYGGGTKAAASRVAYPRLVSPARKWEPQAAPQKACPQRAPVNVPRRARPTIDRDDPRYWYTPQPGRKPAAEILAEMEAHRPQKPKLPRGRDQAAEKHGLQDKFRYAGGNAMPAGAMGHVPKGEVPNVAELRKERDATERWDHIDDSGLTKEQRGIFTDLTAAIADKQARLKDIDAQEAADTSKFSKAKTQRNREALALQNDIQRNMGDIDKLLELTA